MSKKERVLHVISSFGMGGAETWLLEMVKYSNNHPELDFPDMEFLCTSGESAVLDEEIILNGGVIYYISLKKDSVTQFIRGYRKLLKSRKYSAIHDHQDFLSGWHFLFGTGVLPKKRISHVHNPSYQIKNNYGISFKRRLNQKLGHLLVNIFSTYVGGTSAQVLEEYGFNLKNKKNMAIHCSFDLSRFRRENEKCEDKLLEELNFPLNTKILLYVGRFDKSLQEDHPQTHKNTARAIKIFHQMNNKNVVMLMAGKYSSVEEDYNKLIKELEIEDQIVFLGLRNDVAKIMKESDALLFPSRAEGLGMVAVEAQASSLPVIASSAVPKECVVIDELVTFVDLKSTNQEWAEIINAILENRKPSISLNDPRWQNSLFNIKNSMSFLKKLMA